MKLRWLLLGLLVLVLLGPAAALSAVRLLDPVGGTGVRLVAFTPLAFVLYTAALLPLALAWWRGRKGWRVLAKVLVVGCAAGLLLHAFWASGPYVGSAAAEAGGRGSFRVMTANLELGRANPSRVVEAAVQHGIDVLVLEEVTPAALGGMQAAGLGTAFPHTAGHPAAGARGTMVLSTHRITHVHRLETGFDSWAMDVHVPGGPVHLVAVHSRPPVGDARDWLADQAVLRREAVDSDGPIALVGDFNATLDHRSMRELVGRGFDDAVVQSRSRWEPTWPSAGEVSLLGLEVPSLLQIDHVMVNRGLHAQATETVTVPGTDHRAVLAILGR